MYNSSRLGGQIGSTIGGLLGKGLGAGITALADKHLKSAHISKSTEALQGLGFQPQQAQFLANLEHSHPEVYQDIIKKTLGGAGFAGGSQDRISVGQTPGKESFEFKEAIKDRNAFLKKNRAQHTALRDLGAEAKKALALLEQSKNNLPNLMQRATGKGESLYHPNVRTLMAMYKGLASQIAASQAAGTGFRSGKALLDAAENAKASVDQPYETQRNRLMDLIQKYEESVAKQSKIAAIKEELGEYPVDIQDRLSQMLDEANIEGQQEGADAALGQTAPLEGQQIPNTAAPMSPQAPIEPQTPQPQDTLQDKRNRVIARAAEGVLGQVGDLASLGISAANYGAKKLTGKEIPYARTVQEYLPGADNLRKVSKSVFKGKLEPVEGEDSFIEKVASDFGSYLNPVKGGTRIAAAAGRALAGNSAATLAKSLGVGEAGQAAAKLTANLLSMFPGSARYFNKKSAQAYSAAREAIPENARVRASGLREAIKSFKDEYVSKGDSSTEAKKFLKDRANAISKKVQDNTVKVEEVWELKRDFNSLYKDGKVPEGAKKGLNSLIGKLNNVLEDYSYKNQKFGRNFQIAEDIYKGFRQMDKYSKFIVKNTDAAKIIKRASKGGTAAAVLSALGAGAAFSPIKMGTKAALGAGAYGLGQTVKYANFIKNSQQAQKTYADILKWGAKGDLANFSKSVKKMELLANNYDKKEGQLK